jgi:hypothetical protein
MSRWQKEFETTSVGDLRRMVAHPRRAFTISMFSLVTSILALLVSAYAAFWKH